MNSKQGIRGLDVTSHCLSSRVHKILICLRKRVKIGKLFLKRLNFALEMTLKC